MLRCGKPANFNGDKTDALKPGFCLVLRRSISFSFCDGDGWLRLIVRAFARSIG